MSDSMRFLITVGFATKLRARHGDARNPENTHHRGGSLQKITPEPRTAQRWAGPGQSARHTARPLSRSAAGVHGAAIHCRAEGDGRRGEGKGGGGTRGARAPLAELLRHLRDEPVVVHRPPGLHHAHDRRVDVRHAVRLHPPRRLPRLRLRLLLSGDGADLELRRSGGGQEGKGEGRGGRARGAGRGAGAPSARAAEMYMRAIAGVSGSAGGITAACRRQGGCGGDERREAQHRARQQAQQHSSPCGACW